MGRMAEGGVEAGVESSTDQEDLPRKESLSWALFAAAALFF